MSKARWIRFFPSDWLAGMRGMTAVETGVYITLIMSMYERGEPIPEDHARLARLCGASNSAFKCALDTLMGKIVRVEAGRWNDRVEKEQVYLSEKSEVGFQTAKARWKKTKQKQGSSDANAVRCQCHSRYQKPDRKTSRFFRARRRAKTEWICPCSEINRCSTVTHPGATGK
jgi:uncharacterized protein YdaU (DUF1376 family)